MIRINESFFLMFLLEFYEYYMLKFNLLSLNYIHFVFHII